MSNPPHLHEETVEQILDFLREKRREYGGAYVLSLPLAYELITSQLGEFCRAQRRARRRN